MNVADSQRLGSALEHLGYEFTGKLEDADVIVLNTCVVRQSAEDKAYGRLSSLRPLKSKNPGLVVNLMGCLVGIREPERLRSQVPVRGCIFSTLGPGSTDLIFIPGRNQKGGSARDRGTFCCDGRGPFDPSNRPQAIY